MHFCPECGEHYFGMMPIGGLCPDCWEDLYWRGGEPDGDLQGDFAVDEEGER